MLSSPFAQGPFWIGTERTLTKRRHYNLVFLHARRKAFPAFADIAEALASVWPWGEMVPLSEVASRLSHQFPVDLVEAAIWKVVAEAAAQGHLLVDLEQFTLSRTLPLSSVFHRHEATCDCFNYVRLSHNMPRRLGVRLLLEMRDSLPSGLGRSSSISLPRRTSQGGRRLSRGPGV